MSEEKKDAMVKWGGWEEDAVNEEAAQLERGNVGFLKMKVGNNRLRFLPPPVGKKSPFRIVHQHFINVPGASAPLKFACPRYEGKKPCPVCEQADKLHRSGNPKDRDMAYDLFAKKRIYANVIDRSEPEKGPQVLEYGKQIHEALIAIRKDEEAGGDFTNPETGFDIIVQRQGTGKNDTEYKVLASRKTSRLDNFEWIDQQHNLDNFARLKSYDEIRAEWGGTSDGGEEETRPAPRTRGQQQTRSAPAGKSKTRPVDEDIEDAEFEEDAPT